MSRLFILIFAAMFLSGCSVIKTTGVIIGTTGKVVYTTAKVTGKVVGATAVVTGKGVRTMVNMAAGKHVVELVEHGSSFGAVAFLNRKVNAELVVDTGATDTVISSDLARKMGVSPDKGRDVVCQVADGRSVTGKQVNIREVRVGSARVYNVQAIVLDSREMGSTPGLLGMSFLNNFIFKMDTEKKILILQKR